jgi:hypothetical protein
VDDSLNSVAAPAEGRRFTGWAQVRAADYVTRYVRHGAGKPVVVLDLADGTLWPELTDALAAGHRVILPEAPAAEAHFAAWLRGFLDGMGLPAVTLIAAGPFCLPALEFALLDPDRLERLVLVPAGAADATGLTGALGTTSAGALLGMLVVRRDHPTDEALELIVEFIGNGKAGGSGGGTG